jgi:hypothetical protein
VLSQVQDDRIWKDIKCFEEIYEKFFTSGQKPLSAAFSHQPIMGCFHHTHQ